MSESNKILLDWAFIAQWIIATTLGWILGRFLLPNLAFFMVGLSMGILQWFTLQHRFRSAWRWILASTAGLSLASLLNLAFVPQGLDFLAGLVLGIGVGTIQWLVLRGEVRWSGWWIVINVVAWTTGMAFLPGFLSTGAMVGLITGIAMELLLRNPTKLVRLPKQRKSLRV